MTKTEYMSRLNAALASLPEEERRNVAAYYEGLFASGATAGRSEEETAASLGAPEAVAAGYMSGRAAAGAAYYGNAGNAEGQPQAQQASAQGGASQAQTQGGDKTVCASYEYAGNPTFVYLNADAAKLNVSTSASADKIYYQLSYKLKSNPEKAPQLELLEQNGGIYINLKYKSMVLSFLRVSDVAIDVMLPQSYAGGLYIKCNAGKAAASVSGNLSAVSVDMDAGKADIDCMGFGGALRLVSKAGKIQAYNISSSTECNINAGKAQLHYKQFAVNANISVTAAVVDILLPGDTNAHLNYTGEVGSFKNAFPLSPYGDIGSGGAVLGIKNSAGKITISKA